eukprot:1015153-Pleurochrysis_carterae.AAC.2
MKQSEFESIHVLYDDVAKHYEHFANHAAGEEIADGPGPDVQTAETSKYKGVSEDENASDATSEISRNKTVGEGETFKGSRTRKTDTREGRELHRSE